MFNFELLGSRVAAVLQRTCVKSLKSNKSRKAILDSPILLFILIRSSLVLTALRSSGKIFQGPSQIKRIPSIKCSKW